MISFTSLCTLSGASCTRRPTDDTAKAKAIVAPLARRAYRRPPTDDELNKLVVFFKNGLKESDNKDATAAGLEAVITVLLQSPAFLYRPELGDNRGAAEVALNAYEVASRLSFALWNSIPDETLLKLADSGDILKRDVLKAQVARMLNDPKGEETIAYFHEKSFNIDKFVGLSKDAKVFPKWPIDLGDTLKNEAALFLGEVVSHGGGVKEIFTAPYTFVNDKNAPLYGVKAPNGSTFAKVDLDPSQRSGILTQIGYLASKGHETENDPIHRGTYIVGEVLCTQLAAPPKVGEVPPPSDKLKTVRDRVTALTTPSPCNACHQTRINPAGFAFEHYDSIGMWRDTDGDQPVNATGEYQFIGTKDPSLKFDGAIQFIKGLVAKKDLHSCYVQKAVEMLYGQRPGTPEQDLISAIADRSNDGASIKEIFTQIMTDPRIYVRNNQETK